MQIATSGYLESIFDARASFYNKARFNQTNRGILIFSYEVHVATIFANHVDLENIEQHSSTTRRHVREAVKQFNPLELNNVNAIYRKHPIKRKKVE